MIKDHLISHHLISPLVSTPSKLVQMKPNSRHSLTAPSRWISGIQTTTASPWKVPELSWPTRSWMSTSPNSVALAAMTVLISFLDKLSAWTGFSSRQIDVMKRSMASVIHCRRPSRWTLKVTSSCLSPTFVCSTVLFKREMMRVVEFECHQQFLWCF